MRWFNRDKGYGFIGLDEGGPDLFVHRTALPPGVTDLPAGARVEFELRGGSRGLQAANVVQLPDAPPGEAA